MGIISDFFSSFSRSGAQVTRDIQSITQRGRVVRRPPTTRPRTRGAGISRIKRRVISSVDRLSKTQSARFVTTQATRIDQAIKRETKARIPTLRDIQMAGYKYGQKNPEAARLIYGSGNFGAGVVRKAIPKDIGVPVGKAMYAFSDGAIHGVRNDPVKALAFVALHGAVGAVMKGAKYIPIASKIVKSEKAMKAAAYGFDIVYSHNVYTRVNAPVVSYYKDGKVLSETSKTMPDGSIQITQKIEQIPVTRKPNTNEKADRLGYIFSTEAGPMVFGAMGIQKVSKIRFKELSKKGVKTTKTTVKTVSKVTKRVTKATKRKVTASKQRFDNVLKEKLPPKHVRLFKKIRTKEMELIFEKSPAKKIKLQKELKKLNKDIKNEVGKTESVISLKLKNKKIELLSATSKTKINSIKREIVALTKELNKIQSSRLQRILNAHRRFLADETGTVFPGIEYAPKMKLAPSKPPLKKVKVISTQEYIKPLTSQLNKMQVATGIKLDVKPKRITIISKVSDLPSGKINIGTVEQQMYVRAKMPQTLKKQFKSIKSDVIEINKVTTELKTNIVKLNKVDRALRIAKTKLKKASLNKKIRALNIIIQNQIKKRDKLVVRIIGKIKSYTSSREYRRYILSIKPFDKVKIKPKVITKLKVKIEPRVETEPKVKPKVKPKTKIKPKAKVKPKTKIIPVPVILPLAIPLKRKVKPKKKKKKKAEEIRAYRVKNPIPTLASFLK